MSDQLAQPVFLSTAQPMAVIDDAALMRALNVLGNNGVILDPDAMRLALEAAVTPPPADDAIPVSVGMVAAGRDVWNSNPTASPNVLLPLIYRAMDLQRQADEAAQQALVLTR